MIINKLKKIHTKHLLLACMYHSLQTALVYILFYAIYSFAVFDFVNPFKWILDLPNISEGQRVMILVLYTFYTCVSIRHWYDVVRKFYKNKQSNER